MWIDLSYHVKRIRILLASLTCCCVLCGCSSLFGGDGNRDLPKFFSQAVGLPRHTREVVVHLDESKLLRILQHPNANQVRVVETLSNGGPPSHRLFDIQRGGVFDLLKLKNADVLLAVNDYIVYDAQRFAAFPQFIPVDRRASVLVQRGRDVVLYKYWIGDDPRIVETIIPRLTHSN